MAGLSSEFSTKCLVSTEAWTEARSLLREGKHVEAAACLLKARASYDPSTATNCRDGRKVLTAALQALTADSATCLGLEKSGASAADVRRAYLGLARSYHPDKTNGATSELFQTITAAYNELLAKAVAKAGAQPKRKSVSFRDDDDDDAKREEENEGSVVDVRPASSRSSPPVDEYREDKDWETMFWRMSAFKLDHGHCYAAKGPLGKWGVDQRVANETGDLNFRRRTRLESIGFNVDDKDWRLHVNPPTKKTTTWFPSPGASSSSASASASFGDEDDDDDDDEGPSLFCGTRAPQAQAQAQASDDASWNWFGAADDAYEISLFGVVLLRVGAGKNVEEEKPAPPPPPPKARRGPKLKKKTSSSSSESSSKKPLPPPRRRPPMRRANKSALT